MLPSFWGFLGWTRGPSIAPEFDRKDWTNLSMSYRIELWIKMGKRWVNSNNQISVVTPAAAGW